MFTAKSKFECAAVAVMALAFAPASAEDLDFEGQTWSAQTNEGSAAQIDSYLGRDALFLRRNVAVLDGVELGDMVIEYDYASTHASGFIGVNFRADSETANLEQFYTRPHQSGQPDATQPIFRDSSPALLFRRGQTHTHNTPPKNTFTLLLNTMKSISTTLLLATGVSTVTHAYTVQPLTPSSRLSSSTLLPLAATTSMDMSRNDDNKEGTSPSSAKETPVVVLWRRPPWLS